MSRLGIQLTVDDIGSDWSTIDNLQQFSINTMKIDGSLIQGLADTGGVSRAMVETIVHVSHSLGICTVAESVETAQQVKILRELGADVGQGYFFAKPLAVGDALVLTTMDPLPVFPLTDLSAAEDDESPDDEPEGSVYSATADAAEVLGALDAAEISSGPHAEVRGPALSEDMQVEAADVSLVAKRGRLLAFRKSRPS